MLAAVEAGVPVFEYTPAEIKRAVVGYGRAEKQQVQQMMKLLLGLAAVPQPHDAADALAVAICHLNCATGPIAARAAGVVAARTARVSWRSYRPGAPRSRPGASTGAAAAPAIARVRAAGPASGKK